MIELLVLSAFLLAGLVMVGVAAAAIIGFVLALLKLALCLVILPFKILFKILMIPVWFVLGALGLAAGVVAAPLLAVVVGGVVVVGVLAALAALLLPAIPFVLLGLLLWAIFSRGPAMGEVRS